MPHSLRARLLVFLLAVISLAVAIQAGIVYRNTLVDIDEVFDEQLHRLAVSLSGPAPLLSLQTEINTAHESRELVIQIWRADGVSVYKSSPNLTMPPLSTLGFSTFSQGSSTYRVFALKTNTQIIQIAQPFDFRETQAREMALKTVWPIIAVAPLLMLIVWLVVNSSLVPIKRTQAQVAKRHVDDFSSLHEGDLPDEIRPLVHEFNLLLARLQKAFELQKQFVGDAAHELRSPLTALRLQVQALQRQKDPEKQHLLLERLLAGIDRSTRLVEQLLALARHDNKQQNQLKQPIDLNVLLQQQIQEHVHSTRQKHIDIGFVSQDGISPITGYPDALAIMFRNLIENAIKHTPTDGKIDISLEQNSEHTTVYIEDSGTGIPPEEREHVFKRFYRVANNDVAGSGLGLAIVSSIIAHHGADISLDESETLGGLKIKLIFRNN